MLSKHPYPVKLIWILWKMINTHTYIPGKEQHERDHVHEHETLQQLQKHALNGKHHEFWELLGLIRGEDKRRDIIELCGMEKK